MVEFGQLVRLGGQPCEEQADSRGTLPGRLFISCDARVEDHRTDGLTGPDLSRKRDLGELRISLRQGRGLGEEAHKRQLPQKRSPCGLRSSSESFGKRGTRGGLSSRLRAPGPRPSRRQSAYGRRTRRRTGRRLGNPPLTRRSETRKPSIRTSFCTSM